MSTDESQQNDPDIRIDDPEELSQTQRIREILNRRQGVLEARDRAYDETIAGEVGDEQAIAHYQSRLESLILDLWTKFETLELEDDDEGRTGEYYLKEVHIDTIEVPPPAELMPDSDDDILDGAEPPTPKTVSIDGLQWFIENDPYVRASFSVESWNPPGTRTATNARHIPIKTLDKADVKINEFIDKAGIDADFEEKEQRTKIDRDLLEEADEWRKNNVDND